MKTRGLLNLREVGRRRGPRPRVVQLQPPTGGARRRSPTRPARSRRSRSSSSSEGPQGRHRARERDHDAGAPVRSPPRSTSSTTRCSASRRPEYEAARVSYCEDMVVREEYVEDAITGNMLRIKDQTPRVDDVTLPTTTPSRRSGRPPCSTSCSCCSSRRRWPMVRTAQPVLARAGDGQDVDDQAGAFMLADSSRRSTPRRHPLVPIVVYVQRCT